MDLDKDKLLVVSGWLCKEEPPTPREDCAPRYKDVETLLAKANCICTNIGVEIVAIDQDAGIAGFVIYDKCIPEDENLNPISIPYHIITVVMDPNYLLQTIECLCGSKSNPEYSII